jgi:hypothetical protein
MKSGNDAHHCLPVGIKTIVAAVSLCPAAPHKNPSLQVEA